MASSEGPFSEELARVGFCDRPGWDHESRLRVWTQLLGALEDQQRRDSLFSSLARPQRVSLEIVEEWWKEEKKYYPGSALQNWFYHAQGPRDEAKPPWMYRRRMFILWDREITPIEPDTGRSIRMQLAELEGLRQLAATSAAAHRITLATFPDFTSQSSHLDHGTAGFIPDRISDPPISACVQPCAWLSKVQEHGYPYYLWDILEKKTVECPENVPAYLVISHTWGRWHQPRGKKIKVYGVPWLVPVNTLFDVTNLPTILEKVPFETRYVWLDLVCIPQDGSNLQQTEIARQAAIFSSARWAAVRFNQVASWDGPLAGVNWMSMKYLKESVRGRFSDIDFDDQLEVRASISTGLVKFEDSTSTSSVFEFDGWFTSLWTLQEACMRSDLFLCNKHWEPLRTKRTTYYITLDHLVGLFTRFFDDNIVDGVKIVKPPLSVHEIETLLASTAMHKLLEFSPIDVLVFGDQRYSKDNQWAKAIMSALGVTDWYFKEQASTTSSSSNGLDDDVVDKKYPFAFVKEVYEKFGALFFSTWNFSELPDTRFQVSRWHKRIKDTSLYGTMLPFVVDGPRRRIFAPARPHGVEDHPSVRSWTLHPDGSVHIIQVGIFAAWPPLPPSERNPATSRCVITARSAGLVTPTLELDIHE